MSNEILKEKERLRKHMNGSIQGPNVDLILETIASGTSHLLTNIEAISEQLYIATASERYLDAKMADRGVTRPEFVGLSDEVFRRIGVSVTNSKQITSLMTDILETVYGSDFTNSTLDSTKYEPYNLQHNDTLILSFDKESSVIVTFTSDQFTNITAASANEVSDVITKEIKKQGRKGSAVYKDGGAGGYIQLLSETRGPTSSIEVLGGRSQNKIQFPKIKPSSSALDTQWTVSNGNSGSMRLTWTGGSNPLVGKTKAGDYLNLYSTAFSPANNGSFVVENVFNTGIAGETYIEVTNNIYTNETVIQSEVDGLLIFQPFKATVIQKQMYAAVYHTDPRVVELFIPATTKVIRRDRVGASHLHGNSLPSEDFGPYMYDLSKGYLIGAEECNLTQNLDVNNTLILQTDDSSSFPDSYGHIVFGFGTSQEEGPVPYISRPSGGSIFIDPSYKFKHLHKSGTNISLISRNSNFTPASDGTDYPMYITDVVSGRLYVEELIKFVAATGIRLVINILYPNPIGLEKWDSKTVSPWKKVWSE